MGLVDEDLTYAVIGAFRRVYNRLDFGFLENVYVGALEHECKKLGLRVEREVPVPVYYDGVIVGTYRVDLLIEGRLLLEIKACAQNKAEHEKQVLHYLRSTKLELALLLNFGERPIVRRFIYRNVLKELPVDEREPA